MLCNRNRFRLGGRLVFPASPCARSTVEREAPSVRCGKDAFVSVIWAVNDCLARGWHKIVSSCPDRRGERCGATPWKSHCSSFAREYLEGGAIPPSRYPPQERVVPPTGHFFNSLATLHGQEAGSFFPDLPAVLRRHLEQNKSCFAKNVPVPMMWAANRYHLPCQRFFLSEP